MSRGIRFVVLLAVLLHAVAGNAQGDGYFDPTWAGGGRVTVGGGYVNQLAVDASGKILLAGRDNTAWVGALFANGQIVPTFALSDGSGRATICQLGATPCIFDVPVAMRPQADGRILLIGGHYVARTAPQAHGLDAAGVAGGTGFLSWDFAINDVQGRVSAFGALSVLPNGKILAGGRGRYSGADATPLMGIVRLNTDLSLDTSFHAAVDELGVSFAGGALIEPLPAVYQDALVTDILPLADGRIVVAGYSSQPTSHAPELVRLTAEGAIDATFGSNGHALLEWPGGYVVPSSQHAIVDSSGRIVTVMTGYDGTREVGLVTRRGADGSPSPGFGTGGWSVLTASAACFLLSANAVAIDSAGRILVAGSCALVRGRGNEFIVIRLRGDNGQVDATFGIDGYSLGTFSPRSEGREHAYAIIFDGSGRPLVGGKGDLAGVARLTYDLVMTNGFETAPRGCLPPNCN